LQVFFSPYRPSLHVRSSRAVSRNRSCRTPVVFGVHLDRLDDQVQFVRAVDLSRHAGVLSWRDLSGFSEVVQAVDLDRWSDLA
jgi:hypothetical protein